jgi:hypothetical protein
LSQESLCHLNAAAFLANDSGNLLTAGHPQRKPMPVRQISASPYRCGR